MNEPKKVGRPPRKPRPEVLGAPTVELPEIDEACQRWIAWIDQQPTAFGRLLAARHVVDRLRYWSSMEQAGAARTGAARELIGQGWSYREVAEVAGVSLARVQQFVAGGR